MDQGGGREEGTAQAEYLGIRKVPWGKYAAYGEGDGKVVWLGTFKTAEEAARAYNGATHSEDGQAAVLNIPHEYNMGAPFSSKL